MPRDLQTTYASDTMWIALRRFRRDAQARRKVIRYFAPLGLILIPVSILVGWLTFKILEIVGFTWINLLLTLGFFLLFLTVVVAIRSGPRLLIRAIIRAGRSAFEAYRRRAAERKDPAVSRELKASLYREACLLATLVERLSTAEQKSSARWAGECLTVMRWALGLRQLHSLTATPQYKVAQARSVLAVKNPGKLLVLPAWDLRIARDEAQAFVDRSWAELLARGAVSGASAEDVSEAIKLKSDIEEAGYTADYLVGARTIAELDTAILLLLHDRACVRAQLLGLLVEITAGEVPIDRLRGFFSQFFSEPSSSQGPLRVESPA